MRSSYDDNHYQKVDNWDSKRADENMPRRIDEISKNVEKKGND